MEIIHPVIYILIGLGTGLALLFVQQRRSEREATKHIQQMQHSFDRQLEQLQKAHAAQLDNIRQSQREQSTAFRESQETQINALKEEFERERKRMQEQARKQEEDIRRESMAQFKALAADIMDTQTSGLKQSNSEHINAILKPLSENIESFRKAVNDSYVQETASRKSLTDQIDRLMKLNETIGTDAKNLTSALRGNSKVQGDWGEMILETMLENAGLEKGIHYTVQQTRNDDGTPLRDEKGALQRPDVIVQLPDSRKFIIDSKVSLTAFTDLCNADDESTRRESSKRNLESVRRHINELADKKYQKTVRQSADHVLMFIPNEGAYIAAMQSDPELWQYAYERDVVIVSPTHLFSVMKIVSQLWVQQNRIKNTEEIAEQGGKLYDKIALYVEALNDLGKSLANASKNYDTAMNRLSTGRGSMLSIAEKLKKMGAKVSKPIPGLPVEQAEDEPSSLEEPGSIEH